MEDEAGYHESQSVASIGKEIWIHEGLNGMTSRGVNYWQSDDGKDRRLLFSINNFLQEIDARTGLSIPTFGLDGTVDLRTDLPRGEKMGWNPNSPGKIWKNSEIPALIAYLASTGVNRPGRGAPGRAPVFPPGPVVARGGAPLPSAPPRSLGPFYPGSVATLAAMSTPKMSAVCRRRDT